MHNTAAGVDDAFTVAVPRAACGAVALKNPSVAAPGVDRGTRGSGAVGEAIQQTAQLEGWEDEGGAIQVESERALRTV
jgi:hypothetical protein